MELVLVVDNLRVRLAVGLHVSLFFLWYHFDDVNFLKGFIVILDFAPYKIIITVIPYFPF